SRARLPRRQLAFLQITDRALNDMSPDATRLVRIADEQRVVAHDVHDARYAAGILSDGADCRIVEQIEIAGPRDPKPRADVVARLRRGHRRNSATQTDALFQLAQPRRLQLFLQFRLAD